MFLAPLFVIAKNWKLKFPGVWINYGTSIHKLILRNKKVMNY